MIPNPNPAPKPGPAQLVAGTIQLVGQLVTMGFIPKGWATRISAGLQIVSGVGLLAGVAHGVLNGATTEGLAIPVGTGVLLLGNGLQATGLGRKSDQIEQRVEQVAEEMPGPKPAAVDHR